MILLVSESIWWCGKQVAIWGGGLVLIAITALWYYQDTLLYYPTMPGLPKRPQDNPEGFRSPADYGLPYEDMRARTEDGLTIHGWLILQPRPREAPTVLFFHGNAGNIGFRLTNAAQMHRRLGCNVLLVDYRGYGDSEGPAEGGRRGGPNEAGLKADARAALAWLEAHPKLDPGRGVVAFGRSLGGAVAIHLAHACPGRVHAVAVENTFLSISAMVDAIMPRVLQVFKPLVLRIDWGNERLVPDLRQPILFLGGDRDELVPPAHMRRLHALAARSAHRDQYIVKGGTHNDTWHRGGEAYYRAFKKFIDKVQELRQVSPSLDGSTDNDTANRNDNFISNNAADPVLFEKQEKASIPIMPTLFGGGSKQKKS